MKKFIFLAAVAGLMCSCASTYKTSTARSLGVPAEAESVVNVSDLKVSETKAMGECVKGKKSKLSKKQCEANAIAAALEKSRADILVEPQFTYDYNKRGKLTKVTVWGYPAHFTNFRNKVVEKPCVKAVPVSNAQTYILLDGDGEKGKLVEVYTK